MGDVYLGGLPVLRRVDRIAYDETRDDLLTHYETTGERKFDEAKRGLAHLTPFFAGWRLEGISGADVTTYAAQRQAAKAAASTINRELGVLGKMLRVADRNDKLMPVPAYSLVKEAPLGEGFFEQEQYEAVRRHLPDDLKIVVTIAHTVGWRVPSEILTLERRQLDLEAGTLRLDPGTTKNRDGRLVYLTPELKAMLAAQVERVRALERRLGRIIPWLFPHLTPDSGCLGRRGARMQKAWKAACKRAGVAGRIPHDFRRTSVRNLERRGVPRSVPMKVTGHRTESVYRRYAIVRDADLQEAARRLAGTFPGRTGQETAASQTRPQ